MASFISLLTRRQADRTTLMFGICAFILRPPSPLFRSNVFSDEPQLRASEKLFLSARPRWGVPGTPGNGRLRPAMPAPTAPLPHSPRTRARARASEFTFELLCLDLLAGHHRLQAGDTETPRL